MKKWIKHNSKIVIITISIMLSLLFVCCAVILTNNYSAGLTSQSRTFAEYYSEEFGSILDNAINHFILDATAIADVLPQNIYDMHDSLFAEKSDEISFFRLVKDGEILNDNGIKHEGIESPLLLSAIKSETPTVTGIMTDTDTLSRGFYVYVPTFDHTAVDGILVFYYIGALENQIVYKNGTYPPPSYAGVFSTTDNIFLTVYGNDFPIGRNDDFFDRIRALTSNKSMTDTLEDDLYNSSANTIRIDSTEYLVCFRRSAVSESAFCIVTLYSSYELCRDGFTMVNTVYAIIIVLALLIIFLLGFMIYTKIKERNRIDDFESIDPVFNCPTTKKFSTVSKGILQRNKITKFAVINIEVAHFSYIEDNFGEDTSDKLIQFIINLLEKSLLTDETYGKTGKQTFALLFHYGDQNDLFNRLKVLKTIVYNCPIMTAKSYNPKLHIGIYLVERDKNYSISTMISCAVLAEKSSNAYQVGNMHIYDEKLHEAKLHEAEIESIMESSLNNNEFKVFYQPKLNIAQNRTDGAEALVRWFDPKNSRFRKPSEFINLFEVNGFISRVDRYVFVEVCKYYKESVSRGYKLVPVSVNVSRVTAIQPDFLSFYIRKKKEYGVSDNFLTIEFTESFAYENYDVLQNLVTQLHKNGFKCSIDDFGSGYSSFDFLKALPMDELKLDSFFIRPGMSRERDDILLSNMIDLAKKLGMKVTQEGVETQADTERLQALGCDVIQGYIYSKPLPATDYIAFLNSTK